MRFQDVAYEGDFLKIRELAPTLGAPAPGAAAANSIRFAGLAGQGS